MATVMAVAASVGRQQQLPHPDTLSPQQLREWAIQQGRPGGGGYVPEGTRQQWQSHSPETLSPQQLCERVVTEFQDNPASEQHVTAVERTGNETRSTGGQVGLYHPPFEKCGLPGSSLQEGASACTRDAGAAGAGGAAGARGAGAGGTGGAGVARPRGAGAAGAGGAGGAGGATRGAGAGGTGGTRGARAAGVGGAAGAGGAGGATGGAGAEGTGGAGAAHSTGTAPSRPFFYPQPQSSLPPPDSALRQVLSLPSSTSLTPPLLCPLLDQFRPQLLPGSPLPAPAPHTEVTESLTERRDELFCLSLPHVPDLESDLARAASPTVTRLLATVVTDPDFESIAAFSLVTELVDFAAMSRLDYIASLISESESVCPPSLGGEPALGSGILEDRQFELECLAAVLPRFTSMLLCPEGDPDALDIPTLRSYAEAIAGEYSSQWQTTMDAEMASWKSTGTYVDKVPPPGANIVDGMWIFIVKRPPGSPPAFKAGYVARGFSQRQGVDFFQTFSPTSKMTTLRVLLHVAAQRDYELHSLDFSTAFLQGSLHEEIWLMTPVALGFAPSSADPSLFLRADTTPLLLYVLVYVDDLVSATADTEGLALVKAELQERHTCTDLGELQSYPSLQITQDRARRTIILTQSDMVHQVLQRFGFTWSSPQPTPLPTGHSLSAPPSDESVEPSGLYPELVGCLMYLMTCTRPDLAYPLSLVARYVAPGQGSVVLTGHSDTSWADDQLRWLTYLLTDLGKRPRSPPVLYVDNKAMLALCHKQRLEHRTKHIALRYFLAGELQQRGHLRLSHVASRANTADVFTKALGSGDHQRFCTALGLLPILPHLLVS
ncbi:unnamed protein product [Closterium sp. NIES-54]